MIVFKLFLIYSVRFVKLVQKLFKKKGGLRRFEGDLRQFIEVWLLVIGGIG
jgi:hypothetical protein